jgi:teichuronic acid biosynthesis glycosyltransferase TuaG
MPKISIITPCYNSERYLYETYESIKAQTHENWEWCCVDDCSTDNTLETLKTLAEKDPRVKFSKNSENSGAAITRNNALDMATGDYTAFLDSDDLWEPNKIYDQLHFMEKEQIRFSYHNYRLIDENGAGIKLQKVKPIITANELLKFNPFATSSIMIHASITDNLRFKPHLRRRQDYLYWYEALKLAHKGEGLEAPLSDYRIFSNDSLSSNKKAMAKIQWQLLRDEFKINLLPRIYYFLSYAWHGIKKYFL